FDLLAVEHVDLEVELLAELLRLLAEPGRGAYVPGPVAELARHRHAGGHGGALTQALLHRLRFAALAEERDRRRRPARRRARLGVRIEIRHVRGRDHGRLGMARAERDSRRGDADRPGSARLERAEPARDRCLERLWGSIAGDADDDPALRDPRRLMQIEQLALLQQEIAFADGVRD